jgi:hypothetical protein
MAEAKLREEIDDQGRTICSLVASVALVAFSASWPAQADARKSRALAEQ